jgi:hypothetical protein
MGGVLNGDAIMVSWNHETNRAVPVWIKWIRANGVPDHFEIKADADGEGDLSAAPPETILGTTTGLRQGVVEPKLDAHGEKIAQGGDSSTVADDADQGSQLNRMALASRIAEESVQAVSEGNTLCHGPSDGHGARAYDVPKVEDDVGDKVVPLVESEGAASAIFVWKAEDEEGADDAVADGIDDTVADGDDAVVINE